MDQWLKTGAIWQNNWGNTAKHWSKTTNTRLIRQNTGAIWKNTGAIWNDTGAIPQLSGAILQALDSTDKRQSLIAFLCLCHSKVFQHSCICVTHSLMSPESANVLKLILFTATIFTTEAEGYRVEHDRCLTEHSRRSGGWGAMICLVKEAWKGMLHQVIG